MAFSASWVQRQLAQRLTELHKASGMSPEDVARQVGIDRSTLQRIQQAKMRATPRMVDKLCRVYQVWDEASRLCAMAVASRTDAWWEPYRPWLSASYAELIGYENEASVCRSVHPTMVHGLLQTPEYMRVVISEGSLPMAPDQVDALMEVRALRQRRLVEQPTPLQLDAYLGEPTLYWEFGGVGALREQLVHLRTMLEMPNVSVRIVPFSQPRNLYPLDLVLFEEGGPSVVFSETQFGNHQHNTDHEIRHALRTIERTAAMALSTEESSVLIDRRIKELGNDDKRVG